ncbi:MAG: F0F1 ATP synthase subunit alpha, partial [Eubacterium sp.]|nr:F0F1 ATP synthase subunit alpha [Eubacterium sp.]
LPVEKQTVIIYAAVKHYLLDIPVDQIAAFEADLFEYISTNEPDIFTRIREEKVIADDVEEMLVKAIEATKAKSGSKE